MSDADVKANIAVSTDVEQATQKTGKGIVSMQKQIEDIQKKFSTFGKDLFLGFFAPMAIFQTVTGYISDMIQKAKQDAKDGLELIAKGETVYATAEEKKMAAFFKAKKQRDEEMGLVDKGKTELATQFIETPQGKKIAEEMAAKRITQLGAGAQIDINALAKGMAGDKEFQKKATEAFLASPEGKAFQTDSTQRDFKTPQGFSNVVGMGANPVIEAMTAQLEEAKKTNEILSNIASGRGTSDGWLTAPAPSRASMLKSK